MRMLAVLAFSFAAGIFAAQYALPAAWLAPLAAVCGGLGLLGFFAKGAARRRVFLIAWGVAAALLYNGAYAAAVQAPAEALAGQERAGVAMTLCGYPAATSYGAKVTVIPHLESLHGVRVVYYGDKDLLKLTPGCTVTDSVQFVSAAHMRDEDVTAFTSKGIFLLAYTRGEPLTSQEGAGSPRWWPVRLGKAMRGEINRMFRGDTAAFLTALLTGDKTGLGESASADLSEAGMFHILAVSGMHCAFLLALITLLVGKQRRRLRAGVAIPLLLFYMLLTGCTPSVTRACVMLIFLLLAPLFRREGDPPTSMGAALLAILVKNPFAAASVSLQLSFAAVAGLLWLTPKLHRALLGGRKRGRAVRFLSASVSATLGALVFTVPLCAWYFNLFSLVSPLSNLLCLGAAGLAFCTGLPAVLLGLVFPALGPALSLIPGVLIRYILYAAHLLAKIPYHAVYFNGPYLRCWLAFAYFLFGLAALARPSGRRKYALAGALAVLTLAVSVQLEESSAAWGTLNVTALDVGQGECIALSSGGEYAVIDCGSGNSWKDAGVTAAEALRSAGCRRLAYVMLTHYDSDHISGVARLLARIPADILLAPDTQDEDGMRQELLKTAEGFGVPVEFVTEKTSYPLGQASVTVYPPAGGSGDNEKGLTYLCTQSRFDLLVTGDMDAAAERLLIEKYRLPDIEVLVVGHHGSRYSTSEELLEAVRPEAAVVSVGSNHYGHPAAQTLRRLAEAGVRVYRTDLQGDIHFTVN